LTPDSPSATPPRIWRRNHYALSAFGRYGQFFLAASPDRRPIHLADLVPTDTRTDGFHNAGLNINLVVRWEYRLGSTFFAVYTHAGESLPSAAGQPVPDTLAPTGLLTGRSTDAFMLKWSYWWDL
jgi:hypothetical protein